MEINQYPDIKGLGSQAGKTFVIVSRNEWQSTDWAALCVALGAEVTEQRIATLRKTAAEQFSRARVVTMNYELDTDGTVRQRPVKIATDAEAVANMEAASRGGDE